jgi:hypothetical protein
MKKKMDVCLFAMLTKPEEFVIFAKDFFKTN